MNGRVDRRHLVDDFIVGRNAAKYGLKTTTFLELCERLNMVPACFFHLYAIPNDAKVVKLREKLVEWGLG